MNNIKILNRSADDMSVQLSKFVSSLELPGQGVEIDLGRLSESSSLDRATPGQLEAVELAAAESIIAQNKELSLIYTGGFGRFRLIDSGLAETFRSERLEEWNAPEVRQLREMERKPIDPVLSNCSIVSGIGNIHFADAIAARLGLPLTTVQSTTFANSEVKPVLLESVRGKDVFLVQRFSAPVNEYLVGTQLIIDALQRASAKSITLVAPYFPYARQDRRGDERTAVSTAVMAKMWQGQIDGLLTVDIHSPQTESLFSRGYHNFSGHALMLTRLGQYYQGERIVAVFPDEGGAKRAEEDHLPKKLEAIFGQDLIFAHMTKRRAGANNVEKVSLMLENREALVGRTALMFDDILDTGGTAEKAAHELKKNGASEVVLVMTHAVVSRAAIERLQSSMVEVNGRFVRAIDRIFVTDSLPIATPRGEFVEVVPLGELYSQAILKLCQGHGASLRGLSDQLLMSSELSRITQTRNENALVH
jgi:ribose-phosphate pyrophosphokinase